MSPSSAAASRYGNRGGGWLPADPTPAEEALAEAVASGAVVYVRCRCPIRWWIARRDLSRRCHSCASPYEEVTP